MLYVSIRSRALDLSFVPPSFDPLPRRSCSACLPPCVRRPAATGPVRRRRVVPATRADYQRGFVESYPASRRVVVILSLPRSPCSARRSDTFPSLGPWTRPNPRQLCKTPCGGKQSLIKKKSFRSDGVLSRRWQGSVMWAQPRILASTSTSPHPTVPTPALAYHFPRLRPAGLSSLRRVIVVAVVCVERGPCSLEYRLRRSVSMRSRTSRATGFHARPLGAADRHRLLPDGFGGSYPLDAVQA